jgi:hypothetical protein
MCQHDKSVGGLAQCEYCAGVKQAELQAAGCTQAQIAAFCNSSNGSLRNVTRSGMSTSGKSAPTWTDIAENDRFACHWAVVLGDNESAARSALTQLDNRVTARFKFDHILLGEYWENGRFHFPGAKQGGLSGLFMNDCPYSSLANATYGQWEKNYDQCMQQHLGLLPDLFNRFATHWNGRRGIPMDWTGLVVWDVESWNPSWQDSTWSLNVEYWEYFVANISSPVFDTQFVRRSGFKPPPEAIGWANLSRNEQTELMQKSYDHFARDYFGRTLNASKALRPHAQWGFFSYPFVAINGTVHPDNYPPFGYRGEPTNASWQSRNDRLGWLWSMLDVFLPQLYPAGYVTADGSSDNPCGEAYSTADNERFITSNMEEMARLRAKFRGRESTPILAFLWQHPCDGATKLCHNNMSVWMSDLDIEQHFALLAAAGQSDGLILWGDPYYFGSVTHDGGAAINDTLTDLLRFAPYLEKYCAPALA